MECGGSSLLSTPVHLGGQTKPRSRLRRVQSSSAGSTAISRRTPKSSPRARILTDCDLMVNRSGQTLERTCRARETPTAGDTDTNFLLGIKEGQGNFPCPDLKNQIIRTCFKRSISFGEGRVRIGPRRAAAPSFRHPALDAVSALGFPKCSSHLHGPPDNSNYVWCRSIGATRR